MVRREEADERKKDSNPQPLPLIHACLDGWMNGWGNPSFKRRHYNRLAGGKLIKLYLKCSCELLLWEF